MVFSLNYTCPSIRIAFDIPHAGSYAFTSLHVAVDPGRKQIMFEKTVSYTSCPWGNVIFHERVSIKSRDALRECASDEKCKEFVNFYITTMGFTIHEYHSSQC